MEKTKSEAALAAVAETSKTLSLSTGVKPEAVKRRIDTLVQHGTDPLLARALAEEAETIQVHQDHLSVSERAKAEETAKAALPDRLQRMTLAQLREYAAEESVEVPGEFTLKKDVLGYLLELAVKSEKKK